MYKVEMNPLGNFSVQTSLAPKINSSRQLSEQESADALRVWGRIAKTIGVPSPYLEDTNLPEVKLRGYVHWTVAFKEKLHVVHHLDLSLLRLKSLPAFLLSPFTQLKGLDLSWNELRTLSPDLFSSMPHLECLALEHNLLTELPASLFAPLTQLKTLRLMRNRLSTLHPSQFSSLTSLRDLYLSSNRLNALPEALFSQLVHLKVLMLSQNQLSALHESTFGVLRCLERLDLTSNQLRALPLSLAMLPQRCNICVQGNRFSAESALAFQQAIVERAGNAPVIAGLSLYDSVHRVTSEGLPACLSLWLTFFRGFFPKEQHASLWEALAIPHNVPFLAFYQPLLGHEKQESLRLFLMKLRGIEDFVRLSTKRNVVLKIVRALQGAVLNDRLREALFAICEDAVETCGDRVNEGLNRLEVQWHIHCAARDRLDRARYILSSKRIEVLNAVAMARARERNLGDQVELALYYQLQLKERLGLPFTMEGMLYPAMVEQVITPKEELERILVEDGVATLKATVCASQMISLLGEDHTWAKEMQQAHPAEFERICKKFVHKLERLDKEKQTMMDWEYAEKCKRLIHAREEALYAHVLRLTSAWVRRHFELLRLTPSPHS